MQRSVWNDLVSWQTRRRNNSTEVSTPCIDDHHFKEEEAKSVGELAHVPALEVVVKLLFLGTNWTTRYFMVSEQTSHDPSQNGPKHVTNA